MCRTKPKEKYSIQQTTYLIYLSQEVGKVDKMLIMKTTKKNIWPLTFIRWYKQHCDKGSFIYWSLCSYVHSIGTNLTPQAWVIPKHDSRTMLVSQCLSQRVKDHDVIHFFVTPSQYSSVLETCSLLLNLMIHYIFVCIRLFLM